MQGNDEWSPELSFHSETVHALHGMNSKELHAHSLCASHHAPWTGILAPDIYGHAIREKVMIVAEEKKETFKLGILDPARGET
ncbi:hypothetical protein [Desulfoluna butyratoxydans]|uniref:hypothetical protein n=1 Tax=Desulfoluna butyratoxydans TaxID=231438 RepID=UPI0015D296E2|nr:hypothetical protein [Desulfoluna butyratoxydans]